MLRSVVASVLLSACGQASVATHQVVLVDIPVPPRASNAAADASAHPTERRSTGRSDELRTGDVFGGTYVCAQGESTMRLRVTSMSKGRVEAIFEFEHAPSSVKGSFRMTGTFDPKEGALDLAPTVWIVAPPHYAFAPISGHLRGSSLDGSIRHPKCGAFKTKRINEWDNPIFP